MARDFLAAYNALILFVMQLIFVGMRTTNLFDLVNTQVVIHL